MHNIFLQFEDTKGILRHRQSTISGGSILLLVYISILVRHQKVAVDPGARDGVTNKLQKYFLHKHLNTINMSANILLFVYICIFVRHHVISMLRLRSSYPI